MRAALIKPSARCHGKDASLPRLAATHLEDKDVIEHKPQGATAILAQRNLAHGCVGAHMVNCTCSWVLRAACCPRVDYPDIHIVQMGYIRRPELGMRDRYLQIQQERQVLRAWKYTCSS